ncbi:MAG: Flagellar assembly factor FliW [Microbacteriaceae bacterium]|jgi:flagellar assembly factor FliW|nr:Flagellar assembly factor FliW [Microbacteriaceae bacterium]HEV7956252.1 flagellar assembly protein FliW [Marisediminicola sp.]
MSMPLQFITAPRGFEPLVDFALHDVEGVTGLYALRATESETRVFVVDAGVHLPDYTPEISNEQGSALQLESSDNAIVLVVANPGNGGMTLNLMAPIVVNATTGRCAQVILEGQEWPLRAELAPRLG